MRPRGLADTTLKQFSIISSCLLFLVSTTVGAASDNASLPLKGSVAEQVSIDLTTLAAAQSLNIEAGETATEIADVTEESNASGGYTVSMHSTNAGELINTQNANAKTTYQIKYGASGSFTTPGTSSSPVQIASVSPGNSKTITNRDVFINVDALSDALSGDYTDTVTFTIESP